MQENRLFRIIYHLLEKGSSTAPELARKLEVSVRTIYRDIDAISNAGIPIYATQGKGGGITISKDFVLDKSFLSAKEKEQILMALQGIIAAGGTDTKELLSKLSGLFQAPSTNWIEVDFSSWKKNTAGQDIFNDIKKAIFGKNMVSFRYFSGSKEISDRRAAPLKLVFKSMDWYLYGFCLLRNDYRFFKLTRIKELHMLEETYSADITIPPITVKQALIENTIPVTLKFQREMAFRVYDEFADEVSEDNEGYLYVHTLLPDNDMLYSYLLSFSEYVEVLEPTHIRERLKENLIKIYGNYIT